MSAGEEEEHGMEAIIKALMKALTDIKGSPMDSLKPPTFDWNSSEQFEDLLQVISYNIAHHNQPLAATTGVIFFACKKHFFVLFVR